MTIPTTGCAKCNYTGFLHVNGDDARVQQCICSYAKTLKAHLGPEISAAPTISASPFYALGEKGQPPKVDRTKENLFVKSYWSDLLPHLKWVLGCKGPMFRFRIVTDEKLKTVYLGGESYGQRSREVRNDITTYNSIGDLVGADLDLVIVRLGFLGYKNVAMPGILKEALMLRESALKPTWVVEVPSSIFGPGHFSYNEDVANYIDRLFDVVNIVQSRPDTDLPHGFDAVAEPMEDVSIGPPPTPIVQPPERFQASVVDLADYSAIFGEKKGKKGKKPGRGDGPA